MYGLVYIVKCLSYFAFVISYILITSLIQNLSPKRCLSFRFFGQKPFNTIFKCITCLTCPCQALSAAGRCTIVVHKQPTSSEYELPQRILGVITWYFKMKGRSINGYLYYIFNYYIFNVGIFFIIILIINYNLI